MTRKQRNLNKKPIFYFKYYYYNGKQRINLLFQEKFRITYTEADTHQTLFIYYFRYASICLTLPHIHVCRMEIINGQQGNSDAQITNNTQVRYGDTTQVRSTYLPAQAERWPDAPNEPRGQVIAQRTFTGAHVTQGSGHHFKRVADPGAYTMPELAPNGNVQVIDKTVDRIVEVIRLVPVQKVVERLVERLQVSKA